MSDDNIYKIKKPTLKNGEWFIFDNTIFSDIQTMDCDNTITGTCIQNKTFDECINLCKQSNECDSGYYIENNDNNNVCVPLRKNNYGNINLSYKLRSQNLYPELSNVNVKTFISKNTSRFPPVQANTVFFLDHFVILNVDTRLMLETKDNNDIIFSEKSTILQILQVGENILGLQYRSLRYGELFAINIPNTSLILQKKDSSEFEWSEKRFGISTEYFSIMPSSEANKLGDEVKYSDEFFIMYSDIYVVNVNKYNILTASYVSDDKNTKHVFKFLPKMWGYACDGKKCVKISFDNMVVNEKGVGTYNGSPIFRHPSCWGLCQYKVKGKPLLDSLDMYADQKPKSVKIVYYFLWVIVAIIIIILLKKINTISA